LAVVTGQEGRELVIDRMRNEGTIDVM
jgi:hypothetical protein